MFPAIQAAPTSLHPSKRSGERKGEAGMLAHARASTKGQVETWVGASFVLSLFLFLTVIPANEMVSSDLKSS